MWHMACGMWYVAFFIISHTMHFRHVALTLEFCIAKNIQCCQCQANVAAAAVAAAVAAHLLIHSDTCSDTLSFGHLFKHSFSHSFAWSSFASCI